MIKIEPFQSTFRILYMYIQRTNDPVNITMDGAGNNRLFSLNYSDRSKEQNETLDQTL